MKDFCGKSFSWMIYQVESEWKKQYGKKKGSLYVNKKVYVLNKKMTVGDVDEMTRPDKRQERQSRVVTGRKMERDRGDVKNGGRERGKEGDGGWEAVRGGGERETVGDRRRVRRTLCRFTWTL